jgi:hypothetical protein
MFCPQQESCPPPAWIIATRLPQSSHLKKRILPIECSFLRDLPGKTIDVYVSILVHDHAGCIGADDMFFRNISGFPLAI